jgi:acetylornithine deacetylase/succinyl-diaminopimelate desuccinylase-like protein
MDQRAQRVVDAISPEAVVELASDLIRIPSFKTEETPLARWLESYFTERGYEVEMQEVEPGRFQVISRLRGSGGGKSMMFNGHIDIDPLSLGWRHDPWEPAVEGDRLYGAGVMNMKGGDAAMITAAEAIRTTGDKIPAISSLPWSSVSCKAASEPSISWKAGCALMRPSCQSPLALIMW